MKILVLAVALLAAIAAYMLREAMADWRDLESPYDEDDDGILPIDPYLRSWTDGHPDWRAGFGADRPSGTFAPAPWERTFHD